MAVKVNHNRNKTLKQSTVNFVALWKRDWRLGGWDETIKSVYTRV